MQPYGTIQIFVKTQDGQRIPIFVHPSHSVLTIKEIIKEQIGVPVNRQLLLLFGKPIVNHHQIISDLNINNEDTLSFCEVIKKQPISPLLLDQCKICFSQQSDPRVLPCGHSFCLSCLLDLREQKCPRCFTIPFISSISEPSTSPQGPSTLPPINWISHSVIEKNNTFPLDSIKSQCDCCKEKNITKSSTKWCESCSAFFCDECDSDEHSGFITRKHMRTKNRTFTQCEKHKKPNSIFCKNHDNFYCQYCIIEEHKGHEVISSEEFGRLKREKIDSYLGPLRDGGFFEVKEKEIFREKEKRIRELEELEERKRRLEEEVEMIEGEIKEMGVCRMKADLGEVVLKKAIEEIEDDDLIDILKCSQIEFQVQSLVKEALPSTGAYQGFNNVVALSLAMNNKYGLGGSRGKQFKKVVKTDEEEEHGIGNFFGEFFC